MQRIAEIPRGEIRRGQSVARPVDTVRDRRRDRGAVLRDEVAPDGHERFVEVGSLIRRRRTEVGCHVGMVPGADNRVLVLVGYTVVVCEGFGEPVGRTDEGCFCIDILGGVSVLSRFTELNR